MLSAKDVPVPVTYGAFSLCTGASGDPLVDERPVASITDSGIGFFSAARDHTAAVRVEFWDSRPPQHPPETETVAGTITLSEPAVALVGIDTGFVREIPTPFTGTAYAEVTCHGRDEAARLAYEEHEHFFSDIEHWLVRIWPKD
jgi:hypothetical protein